MWSASQRVQTVFGFFTTVLFTLAAFIAATSYLPFPPFTNSPSQNELSLHIPKLNVKYSRAPRSYSSKQQEYAHLKFDLDVDFTPLFHWNTKQVFAFLVAKYPGQKYHTNEVTLWDSIIQSPDKAHVKVSAKRNKYAFGDITKAFAGRNATFEIHWNVMPQVGVLQWGALHGSQVLQFPARSN